MNETLTPTEQAALAEYQAWARRLELERWTRYATDPDEALRQLIARERFTSPAARNGYRPRSHR